jgi:CheY-like chemotaxis protein
MKAVGQFAGGTACDFDNLVVVTEWLQRITVRRISATGSDPGTLEGPRKASAKAIALTRQLLTFDRRPLLASQVLNRHGVIMDLSENMASAQGPQSCADKQLPPRGNETILLVEDDAAARALIRQALRSWGYKLLEAADSRDALRLAQQYHGVIDLLIADVVMPHLGGRQLAEKLVLLHPEMKVLFLSGCNEDAKVCRDMVLAQIHFLQKPFSLVELAQKVRQVLEERKREASLRE